MRNGARNRFKKRFCSARCAFRIEPCLFHPISQYFAWNVPHVAKHTTLQLFKETPDIIDRENTNPRPTLWYVWSMWSAMWVPYKSCHATQLTRIRLQAVATHHVSIPPMRCKEWGAIASWTSFNAMKDVCLTISNITAAGDSLQAKTNTVHGKRTERIIAREGLAMLDQVPRNRRIRSPKAESDLTD